MNAESRDQLIGMDLTELVVSEHHAALLDQVARIQTDDAPALGLVVELEGFNGESQQVIIVSSQIQWEKDREVHSTIIPMGGETPLEESGSPEYLKGETPIGITIADPSRSQNPLIYANDGFCELTGYSREEILGESYQFLYGEATCEDRVVTLQSALENEEPVSVTIRNYRKDGAMFWNRVTVIPIRSETGAVISYLGYHRDVTAEKQFDQDLSLFKEQAEEAEKSILVTDPDGTIQYVNPAFERITGYSASEAIGRTPRILKSDQQDEDFYEDLWEEITNGEVWEATLTNQTKHGELIEVRQKIIPVTDSYGSITNFVAIEQDITEDILTTQTLDVLNRVLRHNLRNSLSVISGHAEMLYEDDMDSEAREASIKAIQRQAEAMQEIAEKTAYLREIWDPTDQQTWENLDLEALVERYQREYSNAVFAVETDIQSDILVRNAALFEQALSEAVENAVVHTNQTPPEVTITASQSSDGDQVHISITDNGPGIPDLEQHVIEAGEETTLSHGLGIGIWLMEWVTTTLGGELTITENDPRGSVVQFELPRPSVNSDDISPVASDHAGS
ncbi:PAS domain-containing protein [Salinibaculum rarum]|uniref:PAS domain-containing protein n=1 Tax=Salinibaculum rarum TaxID=3058903 RepID=UPI00265F432C|nr:PAS domain-containing protein [Salinibaculum sp. KK48]